MNRYQQAGEEVDRWAQALEIRPQVVDIPSDLDPAKDIYPLEEMLDRLRSQVSPVTPEDSGNFGTIDQAPGISEEPGISGPRRGRARDPGRPQVCLSDAGVAAQRKSAQAGAGPGASPPRPHPPDPGRRPGPWSWWRGLATDQETLDRALKGAFFEPLALPPAATGSLDEVLADLKKQIQALEASRQQLDSQRSRLRDQIGPELVRIRNRIDLTRTLLRARVLFGKVDRSYLVSGWIPASLVDKLKEALAQELGDRAEVEVLSPEAIPGAREGVLKIPILFNNPYLLRPFERLTTAYGTPAYGEVEPTAFLAVSFLLMFGLMFGDVGQGAVLFLLGYVIFRRFFRYTDYGIILMECGVASVIFGFLYGSVFGVEDLLPALWFSPMKDITYFIKIAILFGVGAISLGLILSFINALRLKTSRLPGAEPPGGPDLLDIWRAWGCATCSPGPWSGISGWLRGSSASPCSWGSSMSCSACGWRRPRPKPSPKAGPSGCWRGSSRWWTAPSALWPTPSPSSASPPLPWPTPACSLRSSPWRTP